MMESLGFFVFVVYKRFASVLIGRGISESK